LEEGAVNLDNVSRDDWIVGGLALLLALALLLFPWFDISIGPFSQSFSATSSPDGWLGILGVLASLAVVADLAVERLSPETQLPAIGGSRTNTRFILVVAAAGFTALKFLFHIHFSYFGWGFYITVIIAAALVYVAMQARAGQPVMPTRPPAPTSGSAEPPASSPPPAS
jgi:hypothetical protein